MGLLCIAITAVQVFNAETALDTNVLPSYYGLLSNPIKGLYMAKIKADVSKEKTKKARQANAEKQKRYRESMKAQGYKARLVWEKPLASGQIRTATPVIREASLSIVRSDPAVREVIENLCETFKMDCEKHEITQKVWKPVYQDIQVLLKPFLDVI